jgi:hypothetical protein
VVQGEAKDNTSSCGIKGHFRKYCYRDGKKRNLQTSHSIGETCFSLQAEVEDNMGPGLSTGPLKSPPTMPTIDEPEEVILASSQYSEGNDKLVNRVKDESSNKLHVLIKPDLEQWK